MRYLVSMLVFCIWVAGVVLAKGPLSTLIAFIIPFWAWYLVIEYLMLN